MASPLDIQVLGLSDGDMGRSNHNFNFQLAFLDDATASPMIALLRHGKAAIMIDTLLYGHSSIFHDSWLLVISLTVREIVK